MAPTFFDTNILVYATLDQDVVKKRVAATLIMEAIVSQAFVISSQVLKEYVNTLIHKSNRAVQLISEDIRRLSPFVSVADSPELILRALDLKQRYSLQFFDALIVAGAERANCDTVYSEDMTDGVRYGKVTIVNPFKVGNE